VPTTTARWQVPVCVVFDDHGGRAVRCTTLVDATVDLELGGCPRWYWPNAAGAGYFRAVLPPADLRALRDHGWAELTIAERRVVTSDALVAVERGQAELPDAMRLVADAVATDRRFEVGDAIAFAQSLALVVPTAALPAYQRWVRASFGLLARAWAGARPATTSTPNDPPEGARPGRWRRRSRDRERRRGRSRGATCRPACGGPRRADRRHAVGFHRLKAALATTTDAEARGDLLQRSGPARGELQDEALALSLDPSLAPLEALFVLFSSEDEAARDRARVLPQPPGRDPGPPARGVRLRHQRRTWRAVQVCEASQRDATVAYVQATFAGYGGGAYEVAQVVDGIDACVSAQGAAWTGAGELAGHDR
jgi:alanyl aminopeptidase